MKGDVSVSESIASIFFGVGYPSVASQLRSSVFLSCRISFLITHSVPRTHFLWMTRIINFYITSTFGHRPEWKNI